MGDLDPDPTHEPSDGGLVERLGAMALEGIVEPLQSVASAL